MPIYEYACEQCGGVQEVIQKISDDPITTCARCSGKMRRLMSLNSFHLKGSGWYVTDYASKSRTCDTSPKNDAGSSKDSGRNASDGTSGAKSESKAD